MKTIRPLPQKHPLTAEQRARIEAELIEEYTPIQKPGACLVALCASALCWVGIILVLIWILKQIF